LGVPAWISTANGTEIFAVALDAGALPSSEHLVLSGAGRTLDRFCPRIVLEANPGDAGEAMTEILSVHGYEFHNITAEGLVKYAAIVPVEAYHNWLCVPHSQSGSQRPSEGKG
jgi:hypothetical protein